MKILIFFIVLFGLQFSSFAQIDSSVIFAKRISGNSVKTWFPGPPAIIDVPRDISQKSFTFNIKPKTAKWVFPRGRNMSIRNYATWSIKKQLDNTYLLMFPRGENYSITFGIAVDNSFILFLTDVSEQHKGVAGGIYFEKKFSFNPVK